MTNRNRVLFGGLAAMLLGGIAWAEDAREITWDDLIPEDAEIVQGPPNTGSAVGDEFFDTEPGWEEDAMMEALFSPKYPAGAVEELDGEFIRIPGFVVPLGFADEGKIKDFLLVPYFGACIHYPPPPPNQMIYVIADEPVEIESTWAPIWAIGKLSTDFQQSDLGSAEYTMQIQSIEDYEY